MHCPAAAGLKCNQCNQCNSMMRLNKAMRLTSNTIVAMAA
eukprot:COSAG06_NODE_4486_length_4209_cov_65.094161_2_plen_40_part_00